MKKKKLNIKENWSKGLTINPLEMKNVKGGGDLTVPGKSFCPGCNECNPQAGKETDPSKEL